MKTLSDPLLWHLLRQIQRNIPNYRKMVESGGISLLTPAYLGKRGSPSTVSPRLSTPRSPEAFLLSQQGPELWPQQAGLSREPHQRETRT